MTRYTHLTEHERYHIYLMNQQHCTLTEIAKTMGRSRSTISREIKRNTGGNGYRYKQARNLPSFRSMPDHRHKAFAFVVSPLRLGFMGNNFSGINVQRHFLNSDARLPSIRLY